MADDAHDRPDYAKDPQSGQRDPSATVTWWSWVLGVVATVVLVLFLEAYYHQVAAEEQARKAGDGLPAIRTEAEAEQRDTLDTWGWVDREAGTVRAPIDRAIRDMVGDEDDGG